MPTPWFESLLAELRADLDRLDAGSLRRRLRAAPSGGRVIARDGRPLINLASNDYLALAEHPRLKAAAAEAAERYGVGSGASRLVSGHLEVHAEAERRFAAFKHAEAALLLPTGFMANLAVLASLAGPGDLILLDKLCHASVIDAARASGAEVRVFPHLGYDKLARLLAKPPAEGRSRGDTASASRHREPRRLIVTDSVFSMDGDVAELPRLCDLAEAHDALLVVDEAHGTGVLGASGAGLIEAQGVGERVHVVVSTASKALGGLGGIITAAQPIIDTLVNHARTFIFTTAPPPAQAATITAALDVVRDEPWRRERVLTLADRLRRELHALGWPLPPTLATTPIFPLIVGDSARALALQAHLESAGFLGVAIRPPTVAPNTARVRLSLRADLSDGDVDGLLRTLHGWSSRVPAQGTPP